MGFFLISLRRYRFSLPFVTLLLTLGGSAFLAEMGLAILEAILGKIYLVVVARLVSLYGQSESKQNDGIVLTVLLRVLAHGVTAVPLAARYGRYLPTRVGGLDSWMDQRNLETL